VKHLAPTFVFGRASAAELSVGDAGGGTCVGGDRTGRRDQARGRHIRPVSIGTGAHDPLSHLPLVPRRDSRPPDLWWLQDGATASPPSRATGPTLDTRKAFHVKHLSTHTRPRQLSTAVAAVGSGQRRMRAAESDAGTKPSDATSAHPNREQPLRRPDRLRSPPRRIYASLDCWTPEGATVNAPRGPLAPTFAACTVFHVKHLLTGARLHPRWALRLLPVVSPHRPMQIRVERPEDWTRTGTPRPYIHA
jgi:hypothetical protein